MTREKVATRTHSIRCTDAIWTAAQERAASENVYLNSVLTALLDGYGQGTLDVTTVTIYQDASS